MKKLTKALATTLAISAMAVPTMAGTIGLHINGSKVATTVAPYQSNGTTLVPLRVVSENLGAQVGWDQKAQKVTINDGSKSIVLTIGSKTATVNGTNKTLNLAPQVKNGTTMVPIRFVSENLDCKVNWDSKTQTVTVERNAKMETIVEGNIITVKNPTMLEGVPSLSVAWMEEYLGAHIKYYDHINRYIITIEPYQMWIQEVGDLRRVDINGSKSPYKGTVKVNNNKSTTYASVDIISTTAKWNWEYDSTTKVLTLDTTKFQEEIEMNDKNADTVTLSGYAKYNDDLSPAKNIEIKISPLVPNMAAYITTYTVTTDVNGYYECDIDLKKIREAFKDVSDIRVQIRHMVPNGMYEVEDYYSNKDYHECQHLLRKHMPILYIEK
ncbi:MAG: copper amine oxidase N-terminal domain-containing protein [Cellulosilyticum sp.]|nr:copper amine oxidase N-terminal domain-containing protein [Cellulosilyticum sp.]